LCHGIDLQGPVVTVVTACIAIFLRVIFKIFVLIQMNFVLPVECCSTFVFSKGRQDRSPLMVCFVPSPVRIVPAVHKVELFGRVIVRVIQFSSIIIPLMLHIHSFMYQSLTL
jgi:hypothetical protein